jgi:hypothetical protein
LVVEGERGEILPVPADGAATARGLDETHLSGKSSVLLRCVALVVLILAGRRAELRLPATQLSAAHNSVGSLVHGCIVTRYDQLPGAAWRAIVR